ncbi:BEM_collapsed_G0000830.mRNA.1.CDS.1 [Saccharomyces cerevisiae]|nr:BEM_collapsed_G0000830.mRNA.1.CDS.1 [Saccharomyces cerevisiae]
MKVYLASQENFHCLLFSSMLSFFDLKLLSCNYQPLFPRKIWQSRNEIGREMNVYLFGKIVWKTKSCSLMNAISKRSLCGTLVTF